MSKAAADPTSYIGIGEGMALAHGGKALKIGDAGYETALRSGKPMPNTAARTLPERGATNAAPPASGKLPGKVQPAGRGMERLPTPHVQGAQAFPEAATAGHGATGLPRPAIADDVLKGYTEGAGETVTYRRVQGGNGDNASRERIRLNPDGSISISRKDWNPSVSIDNGEHSAYFRDSVRGNEDTHIIEFDVPKWFDDFMKENAIDQKEYWKNTQNMGGTAPKRVDRTKPGKAYELPPPWNEWLEEYATNARIRR